MVLQKQTVRIPFGQGVETKADPKVIQGKLLALENGVFHRPGSIKKRNGFDTPYSSACRDTRGGQLTRVESGKAIYSRKDELLITAKRTSRDPATAYRTAWEDGYKVFTDADGWQSIGTREPLSLEVETIAEPTTQWVIPDVAQVSISSGNPWVCYSWLGLKDPSTVAPAVDYRHGHISIVDQSTGAKILDAYEYDMAPLAAIDTQGVHVTGIDGTPDRFFVWLATPSNNNIYLSIVSTASPLAPGVLVLKSTDLHSDMIWDVTTATYTGSGVCSVLAYKEATIGGINVEWYNWAGTLVDSAAIATVCKGAICVFEAYDWQTATYKTVVGYQESGGPNNGFINMVAYNADGSVFSSGIVIGRDVGAIRNMTGCRDAAADVPTAGRSYVRFYVETEKTVSGLLVPHRNAVLQAVIEFDATHALELRRMEHSCLASKAWSHGDKPRVWVCHDSFAITSVTPVTCLKPTQNTYFLRSPEGGGTGVTDERDRTDARLLGGDAGGETFSQSLSAVVVAETNSYLWAGLRKDVILDTHYGETLNSVIGVYTKFEQVAQPATALGPTAQTGGGYVGDADGRFQELGFHLYPQIIGHIAWVTGSSVTPGHWNYCVVYEWTDHEGQIHRSAPSIPHDVATTHDDDAVEVRVTTLSHGDTYRLEDVRVVMYRTENGPGTVYYRLPTPTHRLNQPFAEYIDLYDNGSMNPVTKDAVLIEHETLYTTGDVLENNCPPATSIMNVFQDRLVIVPDEDPTCVWYSKLKQSEVSVSFSDTFIKRMEDGGPITALAAMDTKEIVFKENQIWAFAGAGPNDLGLGEFTEDHLITTDVGCVDRGSVVMTDKGIMFKSHKGIYLLTRSMQTVYLGAPIEAYNASRVLDAQLVETKNQVRFLLEDNHMLVYDYLMDQWSVFLPAQGAQPVYWDAVDSCMWKNTYVMIKDTADVYVENAIYTDDLAWIKMLIDTAWINVNGIQGFQRVRWVSLLGDVYGELQLIVDLYYNYVDTSHQTFINQLINPTGLVPPAQLRIRPRLQKCQSIRLRIQDAATPLWAGTMEGFSLTDLQLEIGVKGPGVMRQAPLKTR